MSRAWAIAKREYTSFFRLPLGWVVIALFIGLSSVFFARAAIVPGEPATMRDFFGMWWGLLLVLCPAVSMRLFSEELKSGTIESVLTAPVSEAALVCGKHLAGMMFLVTMLAPSLVYVAVLGWLARPDYGPIASGYIGLALLGSLYLSVGCLASSLTSSQTLAFLATLFALVALDILPSQIAPSLPPTAAKIVYGILPSLRMGDFARGLINSAHAAYFIILSFWFLTVCVVILQSRRWR